MNVKISIFKVVLFLCMVPIDSLYKFFRCISIVFPVLILYSTIDISKPCRGERFTFPVVVFFKDIKKNVKQNKY